MPAKPNMFDNDQLVKMRAEQPDPLVMYFIVRKDLNMDVGKIAAQCGHAAQMIMSEYFHLLHDNSDLSEEEFNALNIYRNWTGESFRKIVKGAKQKEFEKIKEDLDCWVVRDAGLTNVDPGSETVLVLWPMKRSATPKSIHKLQLLK